MDKKTAKTLGGVSKKKGTDVVSSAAYGAVASATGSGGAPTSFKTSRRSSKLKTQVRRSARDGVVALATPSDLTTEVDPETLKKMKDIVKMECEQGRQQQTTVTPMEEAPPLPSTSDENPNVPSLDEDDEEEVFPLSKAILLDETSSPAVSKKRKRQFKTLSQSAAAELKKKALKKVRKVVVKPPLSPPALPLPTDLLEDPLPEKIPSEEKDVFKDIAAGIVSKEKVEKQLLESQNKFQELVSESEALKRKEEELLTELEELRKAAKISADTKRDLEQMIQTSKSELEQTKLTSSTELQRIRSEAEEKNKSIEMRNVALERLIEETKNRTAETMASNQEEMKRLRHDLEVAKAEEMSLLQRENESQQTKIGELEKEFSKNIQERERKYEMLQKEFLVNKSIVDEEAAKKNSRLEDAEAKNKHLQKQLVELRKTSATKMMELQSQLELQKKKEDQFREKEEMNNKERREAFNEMEVLRKELQETAEAKKVADKITEEAREESERLKAMASKLAHDAENERITAKKKDNELQQIQKHAQEELERLNREKHSLIERTEDAARQQEKLEKSRLEAAEAKNKHLEEQLVELRLAEEKYKTSINTLTSSSQIQMKELQSQLLELQKKKEDQFRESVEINKRELGEVFKREKEILLKELKETAEAKIVADRIAEEAREESERLKGMANKLAEDAKKDRIAAEKKDNELQEIQRQAEEERERLSYEKRNLIKRVEDAERQKERLQKEKEEAMAVERYDYAPAILESRFYKNMVSEVADGAAGVVQDKVVEQNRLLVEDVARCINDLKNDISSSNQDLVSQQDSRLAEALRRLTDILTHSINRGDEIQESANNMIERISKDTAQKQTELSTTIKRLESRFVEEMEHDDSSDTDKIRLAWNLIKQSLIKKIDTTYVEINNLRIAIKKSTVIRDKEYLESAEKAAKRAFLLLAANRELKDALAELSVRVTFYHESREITSSEVASIDPDVLKVEVKSLGYNSKDEDIKTIKIEMSIASAMFNELEAILSDIRKIAEHLANFERQSLQEVETSKIVTNLEDLIASKLYQELSKFHLFASTIEDVKLFQKALYRNQPLLTIFLGAISFLESKKDNRGIMEFLRRKGYNIGEDMANSIDVFFFKMMDLETTEVSKQEGMDVFVSTMSNTLAIVSNLIQTINNNIDDERKQMEIKDEQVELLKEHLLEQQNNFMKLLQRDLNQPSIAMEMQGEIEEGTMAVLSSPSLDLVTEQLSQITNIVKDSEEKHSRDINTLIDSALRETKAAYKDSLDRLETQHKIAQAQQLEQFQKRLQTQKEQHQREQESIKELQKELEDEVIRQRHFTLEQDQKALPLPAPPLPPPPPPPSSTSFKNTIRPAEKASGKKRNDAATDHKMDIDSPIENEAARLMREASEQLMNALTAATQAVNNEEKAAEGAKSGNRNIKMFLKPEKGNFVEIDLSSQDSFPRQINTEGLKEALPDTSKASNKANKASSTSKNSNTLTGKIFLETLKDKVFPYSSKSALEDKDEEGGPALHHPEFFRHAFIRNSTSFTEPFTFAEKSESVRSFTRLLEYSLFNDTARGTRNDNDMLSRLIYVVFEHDAKMIRYLSDITYKFREYASRGNNTSISLNDNRGNLLEAIIATVFSAVMPVVSSMVSRVAEAVSKPAHNDVRIRSTYSLLSLIEKFIFCASKRVHTLKNVLEKSGLVNRLSFYAAGTNADKVMSYDVQYDYSLLRMLLELMTINITNLVDMGIRPLKAAVLSLGTFTDVNKAEQTDQALIPIDKSVLSKISTIDMDVPMTISVINYLSAVTDWYVAKRYSDDDTADKESLNKAVEFMHTLLTNNLGVSDVLAFNFKNELKNGTPSAIVEHVSKTVLPALSTRIENIAKQTKSNDAILVKGASEVGSLGETAANMSLGLSKNHLALPWLEVDFRGGVDDSTLLWVLSGGVHSDEVVRAYQLAVPLCSSSSFSTRRRSAVPLHVKPLIRIINNTSGSDNVFLNNSKKTPGAEEEEGGGGGGDRLHVVNLAQNVSCVLEYSTKDRYEAIINKMYRDGLVLVKGNAEVPRVFPTQDGKWMDNTRDNMTFTPLSVSRWKMPSASLVYGMLSKKKNKDEGQNRKDGEKTATPSVIEFMGGRAGNVFLEMLTLPSEQPIVSSTDSSMDAPSTNKGLWKTNKDGYKSPDAQSMMARLISDNKRPRTESPSSVAMIPYRDAANIVVHDHLEMYNSNSSWWIRGIQSSMRRDAAALFAVQEHLYFVLTPIF